jgi:hypothetical protein
MPKIKLNKKHNKMKALENKIMEKNPDITGWNIDLKLVDLKENKSFSCMSAYYRFTMNKKITVIWFKEDINSNSPMYGCDLGNYFDRVRQQIIYVIFKQDNGRDDVVSFTGSDLGNDVTNQSMKFQPKCIKLLTLK